MLQQEIYHINIMNLSSVSVTNEQVDINVTTLNILVVWLNVNSDGQMNFAVRLTVTHLRTNIEMGDRS